MNDRLIKQVNGLEVSSFRPQWRNLLTLIQQLGTKISPFRCATVEMRPFYWNLSMIAESIAFNIPKNESSTTLRLAY